MMAYQDALSYNIFVQIHVFYMDHLPKIKSEINGNTDVGCSVDWRTVLKHFTKKYICT